MWNLTNQRRSGERGWTRAQEIQGKGLSRGAHWAGGGNAWAWHLVQTSSCAEKEVLGNPLFLRCWHLAEAAKPEPELELLMRLPVEAEQGAGAGAEEVAEATAAAAAAAGRR